MLDFLMLRYLFNKLGLNASSSTSNTPIAIIGERYWYFPTNGSLSYQGDFGERGGALSLAAVCEKFIDENNNLIVPQFLFAYNDNSNPPVVYCGETEVMFNANTNHVSVNCCELSFSAFGYVDFDITNMSGIDVYGVNCDMGTV